MKNRSFWAAAALLAGLASTADAQGHTIASAHPVRGPRPVETETVERAISDATVIIKGKAFPKAPASANAKMQAFCQPYDARQQNQVAEVIGELPKNTNKNRTQLFSSTYSPALPAWVISSQSRTEMYRIGPVSVTVDTVPGGFHLLTSNQFQTEYNSVKNYVLSLNIADKYKVDINAKLEDYVKNYSSYSMEISSSHGAVVHKAVLSGAGMFNGRTAYRGFIATAEVCAPPEVTDVAGLDQRLRDWVNGVVKSLPKTVEMNQNPSTK
jgi:hypothetical protein